MSHIGLFPVSFRSVVERCIRAARVDNEVGSTSKWYNVNGVYDQHIQYVRCGALWRIEMKRCSLQAASDIACCCAGSPL